MGGGCENEGEGEEKRQCQIGCSPFVKRRRGRVQRAAYLQLPRLRGREGRRKLCFLLVRLKRLVHLRIGACLASRCH